ncbi:unnamed protein product [Calypogeia fissa]
MLLLIHTKLYSRFVNLLNMRSRVYVLSLVVVTVLVSLGIISCTIQAAHDVGNDGIQCFPTSNSDYEEDSIIFRHAQALIDQWIQLGAEGIPLNSNPSAAYGTAQTVITMENGSDLLLGDQIGLLSSDSLKVTANVLIGKTLRDIFNKCCKNGSKNDDDDEECDGGSKNVVINHQSGGAKTARIALQYFENEIKCNPSTHFGMALRDVAIVAENFELTVLSEEFMTKSEWSIEVQKSATPAVFDSAKVEVKCENGEDVCVIRARDVADAVSRIVETCCDVDRASSGWKCNGAWQNFVQGNSMMSIGIRHACFDGVTYFEQSESELESEDLGVCMCRSSSCS